MNHPAPDHDTGNLVAFASTGLSALWWAAQSIVAHGPEWGQVAPIILALASFTATLNLFLNDRQRRHERMLEKLREAWDEDRGKA